MKEFINNKNIEKLALKLKQLKMKMRY